jgi:hypothetical protein
MPIPTSSYSDLRAGSIAAIQEAHNILLAERYQFIGYHGCSMQSLRAIVPNSFDFTRVGSEAGTARGPGFYVARRGGLASEFATVATHDQDADPDPKTFDVPRRAGEAGQEALLRIYAKDFLAMRSGTHYAWGVLIDPNVASKAGRNITQCADDLEIVFHPIAYSRLAALPSLGLHPSIGDPFYLRPTTWPAHMAEGRGNLEPLSRRAHEAPF